MCKKLEKLKSELVEIKTQGVPVDKVRNKIRSILRRGKSLGALSYTCDYYLVHDDPFPTTNNSVPSENWIRVYYYEEKSPHDIGKSFSEDTFKASYPSSFSLISVDDTCAIFTWSMFHGDQRGRMRLSFKESV